MIEFAWKGFQKGDMVQITSDIEELKKIGLDETYAGLVGEVRTNGSKAILVNVNGTTRAFNQDMLAKYTYNDMPDVDTYPEEYFDAMAEAYGNYDM